MKHLLTTLLILCLAPAVWAQRQRSDKELSLNFFRNPSIGAEYRYKSVSVHGGYYITNFESNTTWKFLKAGVTVWFLPFGPEQRGSLYTQASFIRGLNRDYENKNGLALDAGVRYFVSKGINVRLGVTGLYAKDKGWEINPTPGISYSIPL